MVEEKIIAESFVFSPENSTHSNPDYFKDIFADKVLNLFVVFMYIFGFLGWSGLIFVSWFEKSGRAGPFRTLANQLVAFNLDQVNIFRLKN